LAPAKSRCAMRWYRLAIRGLVISFTESRLSGGGVAGTERRQSFPASLQIDPRGRAGCELAGRGLIRMLRHALEQLNEATAPMNRLSVRSNRPFTCCSLCRVGQRLPRDLAAGCTDARCNATLQAPSAPRRTAQASRDARTWRSCSRSWRLASPKESASS